MFEIDVEKLQRMIQLHVRFILIDVRTKSEFEANHIRNAFHVEEKIFKTEIVEMIPNKEMPVVIYDRDGKKTASLLREAAELGFLNFVGLTGGYKAYVRQNH